MVISSGGFGGPTVKRLGVSGLQINFGTESPDLDLFNYISRILVVAQTYKL